MKLHIGASRIRKVVQGMSTPEAVAFLRAIWPELTPRQAELIATYPEETAVNGAYLSLPGSWDEL